MRNGCMPSRPGVATRQATLAGAAKDMPVSHSKNPRTLRSVLIISIRKSSN